VLFTVLGVGLSIAAFRQDAAAVRPMLGWVSVAVVIGCAAVLASSRATTANGRWVPAALGTILMAQALMMAFAHFPPAQSAQALLAQARPFIGPRTELFSVDQYRQSIAPYLGRTLQLVRYQGEMQFGIKAADNAGYLPTLDAFAEAWERSPDALAFVDLDTIDALWERQLPFQLRAMDGRSAVITRH
jgi:hypothetical protein